MQALIYSYADYLRQKFDKKVYKLSIDAGFTCPNLDGTKSSGGCTFCSNRAFTPEYTQEGMDIVSQVQEGIKRQGRRYKADAFLAYFQAYSNTYAEADILRDLYYKALNQKGVIGLVIGTRPDCLTPQCIELLKEINQNYYVSVELGIESIFDKTLDEVNRGHHFSDTLTACQNLREAGIHYAAHLLLGLPGEQIDDWLLSIDVMNALKPDYLKFHHLQLFRGTKMARQYKDEPFELFTLGQWLNTLERLIPRLSSDIALSRLNASGHSEMVVAPKWDMPPGRHLADMLRESLQAKGLYQGKYAKAIEMDELESHYDRHNVYC